MKYILSLSLMFVSLLVFSQDIEMVTYSDICNFGTHTFNASTQAKSIRMSNKRVGNIDIAFMDDNMPDSLRYAVHIAANVWADYMNTEDSCHIQIHYDNSFPEDIKTTVYFFKDSKDGVYYPMSLFKVKDIHNGKDADIYINSNVEWRIGIGETNSNSDKKLVLAMIQNICRCLGYGSSIIMDKRGNLVFTYKKGKNAFDNLLLTEDDRKMLDLNNNRPEEIKSFVLQDCGYLYAIQKDERHKIYAPRTYDSHKSLYFSADSASIMYHEELPNRDLIIDEGTLSILSAIGWNFAYKSPVSIIADDIDSTGITSAYQSHSFHISHNGNLLSNHKWEYLLPLKNGGYETIKTSTAADFTIPSIIDENRYERNIEGDIRGIISYSGTLDNISVNNKYVVTLELKPQILKAEIIEITPCDYDPTFYNATVDVYYTGARYLYSYVEEEFNASSAAYHSNIPYYTRFYMKDIDSWRNVWIHFQATNNYGSVSCTIDVPAAENMYRCVNQATTLKQYMTSPNTYGDIYNNKGVFIKRIYNYSELSSCSKGLFFIKIFSNNKYIITSKFINE